VRCPIVLVMEEGKVKDTTKVSKVIQLASRVMIVDFMYMVQCGIIYMLFMIDFYDSLTGGYA